MTIIDKCDRKVLGEGRNKGFGYAILKRDGDTYTTIQPISPCAEYLNDQLFTEHTKKPVYIFGLQTKYHGILEKAEKIYLAMSVCKQKLGHSFQDYVGYEKEVKDLNGGYELLENLVQAIENSIPVKHNSNTTIERVKDNLFLVSAPLFWAKYTYLISLLQLILRNGKGYKSGDPLDFLSKKKGEDSYYLSQAVPKIKKMIGGVIPVQDFKTIYCPHSHGIVNQEFPK